jgi:asparagine synthase (glutamine-hydrolysing)
MISEREESLFGRFGVERRLPFFDRRILEFVLAIPDHQRWRGAQSKFILRQAMAGILPESVRERAGKAVFSGVLDDQIRLQTAQIRSILNDSVLAAHGLVDGRRFVRWFEDYLMEDRLHRSHEIERVIGLEMWLRSVAKS